MPNNDYADVLLSAMLKIYKNDIELLTSHTSEQTISYRLAHYLANALEPENACYYVDCEYQRDINSPTGLKRTNEDGLRSYMRVDILYHDRGQTENYGNIFAIEMKWRSNIQKDQTKLRKLIRYYQYKNVYCIYNISQNGFSLCNCKLSTLTSGEYFSFTYNEDLQRFNLIGENEL